MMGIVDIVKTFLNIYQPINRKKIPRFLANLSDDRISRCFVYINSSADSVKTVKIIMLYDKQLIVIEISAAARSEKSLLVVFIPISIVQLLNKLRFVYLNIPHPRFTRNQILRARLSPCSIYFTTRILSQSAVSTLSNHSVSQNQYQQE